MPAANTPTNTALTVDKDTGAIGKPVTAATFKSANDIVGSDTTNTLTHKTLSDAEGTGTDFAVVVLPDIQNLTESDVAAAYVNAQTQWAADNKVGENIQAVITVGDMMNGPPNTTRLARAVTALDIAKDAGIPVVPLLGNHDYDADSVSGRGTTVFNTGFGPSYFSGKSYYGASNYPSGTNDNYYITFTVDSQVYLVLALELFPRPGAISWAQGIIAANPNAYIIITTHCHLKWQGTRVLDADQYGPDAMSLPSADYNGDDLYRTLIAPNANVKMVMGGHFIGGNLAATNSDISSTTGHVAHEFFVNYQDEPVADQYMMILRFKPSTGIISVSYYSPSLDQEDAANPGFDLAYEPVPVRDSLGAKKDLLAGRDVVAKRRLTVGPGELPNRVHADENGNLFVGADDTTNMSGGGQLRVKNGIFDDSATADTIPYLDANKQQRSATLDGLTLSSGTLSVAGATTSAAAVRDSIQFDGVSGTRAQWALSTPGDGIGAAGGHVTVLQRVMMPAAAATRNLWAIAQSQDAASYGGNALLCYLHSGDKLRIDLSDAGAANRRYLATDLGVISRYASTVVTVAMTHDGTTTDPLLYLNGVAEDTTTATIGSAPTWAAGFNDNFLTLGTMQGGARWQGMAEPAIIINGVLTPAEIATWSRTGRLPSWAQITTGSMVAATSGTVVVGKRYRIASFVSGDDFTNIGAASNATGVEFTATGTTPTTWTNSSQLIPVGLLFRPVVQPIGIVADAGTGVIPGALIGGARPVTTRRDWVVQAKTTTTGNQALVSSNATPFTGASTHRLTGWVVKNGGTTRTLSLGSASGGSQYLSAGSAPNGTTDITLATRINAGTALWCNSDGSDELTHTITGTVLN